MATAVRSRRAVKPVTPEALRASVESGQIEFIGTWEAAAILGVERPRIGRWLKEWRAWRYGDEEWQKSGGKRGVPPGQGEEPETKIPTPLAHTKSGPVWLKSEIEAVAEERRGQRQDS